MKRAFQSLLLACLGCAALIAASGCVSKSTANARAQAAFMAGQQQALTRQQAGPSVAFRGDVRNSTVPWMEDMSLAKALLAAEYTGSWDPHTLLIIRRGETYPVDVKRFMRGGEDPLLEPGDTVEIHR